MLGWKDVMMKQEQHEALLRDAEKRALVRQALMDVERRAPRWQRRAPRRRLLAALVQHLGSLRCYLLERFASALKVPVQTPCQDAGTNQSR